MYAVIPFEIYTPTNVILLEPMRNKVIAQSKFIKLLYSNSLFTMNGIFIDFTFNNMSIHKNHTKWRHSFNINGHDNKQIVDNIIKIENELLNLIHIPQTKKKICQDQLLNQYITLNNQCKSGNVILKISGIWISNTEYGLSFKYISTT